MKVASIFSLVVGLHILTLADVASAAPPEQFESVGVIDSIDTEAKVVVINDLTHTVGQGAMIHGRNGRLINLDQLRVGDKVGTTVSLDTNSYPLYEIWVVSGRYRVKGDDR